MRFKGFFLILLMAFSLAASGQADQPKQPRILILLDASSSMLQPWEKNQERYKTAARIITSLIDSVYKVNDQVEFALRVYGHQHPAQENNCYDTRREVMFSKDNLTQISLRLADIQSVGVSPIAFSLKEAAENDLVEEKYFNYSLVLITDGGESCGGNICEVVKSLLDKKINFRPYIIGLVDYAPLREQYACLGNYLLTTKEPDIAKTVGTIVEAYRPMLKMTARTNKIETPVTREPAIRTIEVPKTDIKRDITPEPEPVKKESPRPRTEPVVQQEIPKQAPVQRPVERPAELPKPRPKEDISFLSTRPAQLNVPAIRIKALNTLPAPVLATKYPDPYPPEEKPVVAAAKPPVVELPKPRPVVKPPSRPAPVETTKPKEAKYNIEREEQKETTLEVFFTDGKGKFYQTTPQVVLLDPKTKAPVHKFFRTVNTAGNPQPQKIPTGVYDLTVTGKSNLIIHNVDVKADNKNKIIVQVGKASLRFEYEDDPNVPVTEYAAKVKKNFEPGPIITQLCSQELEYEPGNYHIEISTQPRDHRSVDLDFGALVVIKIERPGYVNITNTNNMGTVTLFYQLGDQYVQFYKMDVTGDLDKQRLKLQRGNYRASYNRTPNVPYAQETVKQFKVTTGQTTELLLD